MSKNITKLTAYGASIALALTLSLSTYAQDNMQSGQTQQSGQPSQTQVATRSVASGQKLKFRGIVLDRQADTLTVRDEKTGEATQVKITDATKIKSKKFFGGGNTYASNLIVRGLNLRVEGRGDESGALVARNINIDTDDLRAAQSLEARVAPVEGRVTAAEENAQRLSGQLDELVAISNAARGGARAAQETADAAVQGVNATNQRITELDDYAVQQSATVNFKVGSAVLSPEAKTQLDQVAQGVSSIKGYVMEVTGYADATGSTEKNRALSQRRAEAVIQYLVENHGVPLRRILPSYGFGELNSVAENNTREGRAQNRRVEVKLLVSKGLTNQVQVQTPTQTDNQNQQQ